MRFHFQNLVLFRNVPSFSKCERFCDFSIFPKDTIVNKSLCTKICTVVGMGWSERRSLGVMLMVYLYRNQKG